MSFAGPSSYAAKEGQAAQRQQQQQLAAAEDEGPAGESQSTNDSIVAKEEANCIHTVYSCIV